MSGGDRLNGSTAPGSTVMTIPLSILHFKLDWVVVSRS